MYYTVKILARIIYDHFYQVPYQDFQDVHKLVSEQVSQKKTFRFCEGVEPHQFTDREIEDYPDIIDPFGHIDEISWFWMSRLLDE